EADCEEGPRQAQGSQEGAGKAQGGEADCEEGPRQAEGREAHREEGPREAAYGQASRRQEGLTFRSVELVRWAREVPSWRSASVRVSMRLERVDGCERLCEARTDA